MQFKGQSCSSGGELNNHVFIIQTQKIMIKKNVNLNGALQDTCRLSAYLSGYCLVNPEN